MLLYKWGDENNGIAAIHAWSEDIGRLGGGKGKKLGWNQSRGEGNNRSSTHTPREETNNHPGLCIHCCWTNNH